MSYISAWTIFEKKNTCHWSIITYDKTFTYDKILQVNRFCWNDKIPNNKKLTTEVKLQLLSF